MRLFIAIDTSKEIEYYISELQKQLNTKFSKISLTKSFHLTLKFLGEVPESKLQGIKQELSKIKFQKFALTLDKFGFFPNEDYINIVWIGVKEHAEVNLLQKEIEDALNGLFSKDKFHPHITLGRVKYIKDRHKFLNLIKSLKVPSLRFDVDKFKLYESVLKQDGPEYAVLQEFFHSA